VLVSCPVPVFPFFCVLCEAVYDVFRVTDNSQVIFGGIVFDCEMKISSRMHIEWIMPSRQDNTTLIDLGSADREARGPSIL